MNVLKDPNIQVGELRDQPSMVALSLVATEDMNPNVYQPIESDAAESGTPYSVNLSGTDLADMARQLKVALRQVENELQVPVDAQLVDEGEVEVEDQREDEVEDEPEVEAEAEAEGEGEGEGEGGEEAALVPSEPPQETVEKGDGVSRQVGEYRKGTDPEEPVEESAGASNASPVEVMVIQLKDDGRFLGADFDELVDSPEKALGKTYLDHDEFVVNPGQYKFVRFFPVKPGTRYIAVVAGYHDTDRMTWKAIERIEANGGVYPLLVNFGKNGVTIKNED